MTDDEVLGQLDEQGYAILPGLLDRPALDGLMAALAPYEAGRPMGRNVFEGERSHRVYSLAGKGPAFMALAEHPRVVGLLDRLLLPNWLLSNLQSIRLYPGETEQPWHTDDGFYRVPRPRARLAVSCIWAIEDFTVENGATELIPGSHRWGPEHPDERAHTAVPAVMPAGSVVMFDAALWHRSAPNRSDRTRLAISPQYCQPWLRPQESQLLIVPPEAAAAHTARGRAMLGYNIHPPFIGQVDGMHPMRLVDPAYRSEGRAHASAESRLADAILQRPPS